MMYTCSAQYETIYLPIRKSIRESIIEASAHTSTDTAHAKKCTLGAYVHLCHLVIVVTGSPLRRIYGDRPAAQVSLTTSLKRLSSSRRSI